MTEIKFRLEKGDPHFIKLVDPSNSCIIDEGDKYLCNCGNVPPPYIVIYIPEVKKLIYPKLLIKWKVTVGSRYAIRVYKGKTPDTKNWKKIFEDNGYAGDRGLIGIKEIPLDNDYEYYKIEWKDGNSSNEKIWLYKDVVLKGFTPEEALKEVWIIDPIPILLIGGVCFITGTIVGYYV